MVTCQNGMAFSHEHADKYDKAYHMDEIHLKYTTFKYLLLCNTRYPLIIHRNVYMYWTCMDQKWPWAVVAKSLPGYFEMKLNLRLDSQ